MGPEFNYLIGVIPTGKIVNILKLFREILPMNPVYIATYQDYVIRPWQPFDRDGIANIISSVLAEYNLNWEPERADQDVLDIETYYSQTGGEFWVIEKQGKLVGSGAYYPIHRGNNAVEIRKMYFLPEARGQGLGKFLLFQLENAIASRGFQEIWIETASVLETAVKLYEKYGYQTGTDVENLRCDRVYYKRFSQA